MVLPTSARALCQQAENLLQQANQTNDQSLLIKAMTLYTQVIEMGEPQFAAPYIGLAAIAFCGGQNEQALGLLNQAKVLEPLNLKLDKMLMQLKKAIRTLPRLELEPLEEGLKRVIALKSTRSVLTEKEVLALLDTMGKHWNPTIVLSEGIYEDHSVDEI